MRQGERLVHEKGTHNVKFLTENYTKQMCGRHERVCNGTKGMYACDGQRERLWGMLPTDNGNSIMKTQK